jgi:hypothetical protein
MSKRTCEKERQCPECREVFFNCSDGHQKK